MIDLFLFAMIIYLYLGLYLDYRRQREQDILMQDLKIKIENSTLNNSLDKLEELLEKIENKGK